MKTAGFTHGGFYNHFPSGIKLSDALTDERKTGRSSLARFVERYLSSEHRDGGESGSTIAALACDAAREGEGVSGKICSRHRRGFGDLRVICTSPEKTDTEIYWLVAVMILSRELDR